LYIRNFILLVASLQILNLSVCGGEDNYVSNNGTIGEINHIDCLVEYVAEIVLSCKNAIVENGVHNTTGNHSLTLKHFLSKTIAEPFSITIQPLPRTSISIVPQGDDYFYLYYSKITKPPSV